MPASPTTISGLTNAPLPLSGAERLPMDSGDAASTFDASTADVADLAELRAGAHIVIGPERIDASGIHFTTQGIGDPLAVFFPPATAAVAGYGTVALFTGGGDLYTRRVVPATPTRIWEVEAEVEQVTVAGAEAPIARVGLRSLKSDYTDTDLTPIAWGSPTAVLAAGNIVVVVSRFGAVAPAGGFAWADPSTAVLFRPVVEVNQKSDLSGPVAASVARVRRLTIRDVTAQNNDAQGGEVVTNLTIASGVLTIDLANGKRNFKVPLNAAIVTMNFANVPAGPNEFSWSLRFVGDGTARAVAWAAAVKHASGITPTINSTAGKVTRFTMTSEDGGTTIANYKAGEI